MRTAWNLLKPYKKRLAVILLLMLVTAGVSFVLPFFSKHLLDDGLIGRDLKAVLIFAGLLLVFSVIQHLLQLLQARQETLLSQNMGAEWKEKAFAHSLRLKAGYFQDRSFFKIIHDAMYDVDHIMSIADGIFLTSVVTVFEMFGVTAALFFLDWRLSLFLMALLPIRILLNLWFSKRVEKLADEMRDAHRGYHKWFENLLGGIREIKLWGLYDRKVGEYDGKIRTIQQAEKRILLHERREGAASVILHQLFVSAAYVTGGIILLKTDFTVGSLVTFITYMGTLLGTVDMLMSFRFFTHRIAPNIEGLKSFFELEEEENKGTRTLEEIEEIRFDHVHVTLEEKEILKDVSFAIRRGEHIWLRGENGSGKSTLLNVLLRFIEPNEGTVSVNGIPVQEYDLASYRKCFCTVPQDVALFDGTILENISMGREIRKEDLEQYRFASDFILEKEEGWQTKTGTEGTKLSGGEKQKIAFLRAVCVPSQVLILDEATSGYDRESDEEMNRWLREESAFPVSIAVSHRTTAFTEKDRVLELENGTIRETGTRT